MVLLTFVSGGVDAIGFVALGGAFTSVMTGNLVLTGVAAAHADGALLGRVGAAIVCFVTGCAVGARVAGSATPAGEYWPPAVTRALGVEFGLLLLFATGWWVAVGQPGPREQLALLAVNASALGMQSAAVQRFGVPGLSTTYLTGTLTHLVIRLAGRQPLGELRLNGQLITGLVLGGAAGAVSALHARMFAPALPLIALLCVLLASRRLHLDREHPI